MHPTPDNSKQLTPIEKAIEELELLKSSYPDDHRLYSSLSMATIKLQSLLPYERQYLRDVAEKAWDKCDAHAFIKYQRPDIIENQNPDKQTYLNQKYPL